MPIATDNTSLDRREHYRGFLDSVHEFMSIAGQTTDKFNADQAALYTGLQCEELAEKIEAICAGALNESTRQQLRPFAVHLRLFSNRFKNGQHTGDIMRANHADLIDADFDLAWVSVGALMSTSRQPYRAVAHGTYTNLDKFRGGVCVKDDNGKVQKPADWQGPDFTPYIDTRVKD